MKKAKVVMFLLSVLCMGVGFVGIIISLFVASKPLSHRWLLIGLGYLGGSVGFLVLRLLLIGYEKVIRSIRNAKAGIS